MKGKVVRLSLVVFPVTPHLVPCASLSSMRGSAEVLPGPNCGEGIRVFFLFGRGREGNWGWLIDGSFVIIFLAGGLGLFGDQFFFLLLLFEGRDGGWGREENRVWFMDR